MRDNYSVVVDSPIAKVTTLIGTGCDNTIIVELNPPNNGTITLSRSTDLLNLSTTLQKCYNVIDKY